MTPQERRRVGRLGGILFFTGSLFSFPAGLTLEPAPALPSHLLGIIGILTGLAVVFAPWEGLSSRWLHAVLIGGTLEVTLGVIIFSPDFSFYFVIVAIYAAYIVRERKVLAAYMGLFLVGLLSQLVLDSDDTREKVREVLVVMPVLITAATVIVYLRETLERREQLYRGFAYEAISLAARIRGAGKLHDQAKLDSIDRQLDRLAADTEAASSAVGEPPSAPPADPPD
jgi:hypothetical protein